MDTQALTVQATDISCTQEWTEDPDMIQFEITNAFLQKAEKCVAFMNETDTHKVSIWWALNAKLFALNDDYEEASDIADEDAEMEPIEKYLPFQPEYRLGGATAEIHKDGKVNVVFDFKDSSDELFCRIGSLSSLKEQFDALELVTT